MFSVILYKLPFDFIPPLKTKTTIDFKQQNVMCDAQGKCKSFLKDDKITFIIFIW